MVDGASQGDCVEWAISSRYNLKGNVCVCVCVILITYIPFVCVYLCTFLLKS